MNYAAYFAIEKQLKSAGAPVDRSDLIHAFTEGRTSSLKELSEYEYREFINHMNTLLQQSKKISDKGLRQRRKVIALFCNMGYVINDKPDMKSINDWCKKYGHLKKQLNDYVGADLTKLVVQAEEVYNSFIKGIYTKHRNQ